MSAVRARGQLATLLLVLCALPPGASAQQQSTPVEPTLERGGEVTTDAFYGRSGTAVPIQVPAFRGIEPRLSISIAGVTRNGFVGVGGVLEGFGTIERVSPGGGIPRFDTNDVYMRAGRALVACASLPGSPPGAPSPSCVNGGTHAMQIETYEKILLSSGKWFIWSTSGVRFELSPTHTVSVGGVTQTLRWGLTKVADTRGNEVRYGWACEGTPTLDCYPSQVTYWPVGATTQTATVNIYREARSDVMTFATGGATLGRTDKRLKTIEVRTGNLLARAYTLSYVNDAANGHSLLRSVRIYGYDSDPYVNKSTGAITGGTTLPQPVTYTFDTPRAALSADATLATRTRAVGTNQWFGDVNADGADDYVYAAKDSREVRVMRSLRPAVPTGGDVVASLSAESVAITLARDRKEIWLADVNGDGKEDIVYRTEESSTHRLWVSLSDGTRFLPEGALPWLTLSAAPKQSFFADFNGDGLSDFGYSTDDMQIRIALSTGTGFSAEITSPASYQAGGAFGESGWVHIVDLDSDGKADWIYNRRGTREIYVKRATIVRGQFQLAPDVLWGTRSLLTTTYSWTGPTPERLGADADTGTWADLNGDGALDFVYSVSSVWLTCFDPCPNYLGAACEMVYPFPHECGRYCSSSGGSCFCGSAPTQCMENFSSNSRMAMISGGASAVSESSWGDVRGLGGSWIADMNADGKADLLWFHAQTAELRMALSNGAQFLPHTVVATGVQIVSGTSISREKLLADMNGDGKPDFVYSPPNSNQIRALQSTGPMMPLLMRIVSEIGGVTRLSYTPSSSWPNSGRVPKVPTLLAMSVDDGRGDPASITWTSFSYSGGLYDFVDRRFLGFHVVTKRLPCIGAQVTCPEETTSFAQDHASMSKPHRIDFYSGALSGAAPVLLKSTMIAYRNNGATIPYTSLEVERTSATFDPSGSGVFKATSQSRLCGAAPCYDAFGNPTQVVDYGFGDVTGDELTSIVEYRPRITSSSDPVQTRYIVSLPVRQARFQGIGTATKLTDTYLYYDDAQNWTTPPTAGFLSQTSSWLDTANAYVVTRFGYDVYGNRISATDPNGNVTSTLYDPVTTTYPVETRNALYSAGTAVGRKQRALTRWDIRCGTVLTQTNENDQVVNTQYDPLCRVIQILRPGGDGSAQGDRETRSYSVYDGASVTTNHQYVVVTRTGPNATGPSYSYTYTDGRGRVWQTRARGASADVYTRVVRDVRGNELVTTLPVFWDGAGAFPGVGPTKSYDDLGRVVRITHMDGTAGTFVYGANTITTIDEAGETLAGHRFVETFDARGNVVTHVDYDGTTADTTTYEYDARGNRSRVVDPAGNVTSIVTDSLGRRVRLVDPSLGVILNQYDNIGRMTLETDALGQKTRIVYDALGRVLQKTTRDGTAGAVTVSWAYDERTDQGYLNMGRRTTMTDPYGTETDDYNRAGKVIRHTRTLGGATYSTHFAYDVGGRLIGTRYPDGDIVGVDPLNLSMGTPLAYDNAGNLTSISAVGTGTLVESVTYDALGNATRQVNSNGTVIQRVFDGRRGWLNAITTTRGTTPLFSVTYSRDVEGKIRAVTSDSARETWSYDYDERHRLTMATNAANSAENQRFTYDRLGNITFNSRLGVYQYRGMNGGCDGPTNAARPLPHAVTCAGGIPYAYDGAGNMTSGPTGGITYDGSNRPITVGVTRYTYDGEGQRLTTTVNGGTTTYLTTGYEVAPSGVVTKHLPLGVQRRTTGTSWGTYWLHTDGSGSTRIVTDRSGATVLRSSYRPYGGFQDRSSSFPEPLGFAGERQDANGLIYLRARYYDPRLGRFITADPTTEDGLNRYAYAKNNPISFVDRTGYGSFDWGVFFSELGKGAFNVGVGVASSVYGMAQMTTWTGQAQLSMQMASHVAQNMAEGDAPAFAVADAVADIPTLGLYGALIKGPANYAYDPSEANAAAWQQSGGSLALNVVMMRAVPTPRGGLVSEIGEAARRLNARGIHMGQRGVYAGRGAPDGVGEGVQSKLDMIESGVWFFGSELNWRGILVEGHHRAIATEIAHPGLLKPQDLSRVPRGMSSYLDELEPHTSFSVFGEGTWDIRGQFDLRPGGSSWIWDPASFGSALAAGGGGAAAGVFSEFGVSYDNAGGDSGGADLGGE